MLGARAGRHAHALEPGMPHANVGDRLAALVALVEEGDVGAHLAERRVEARCASD